METHVRLTRLDLLIIGGLTLDRFADGSAAPGGGVLHAARAALARGARVGAVLSAGPEPEVRDGLRELEALPYVRVEVVPRSIGFDHGEVDGLRRLRFRGSGGVPLSARAPVQPGAVLYAPVADELSAGLEAPPYPGACHAAILQGWLRRLEPGAEVEPLPLAALPARLLSALGALDLLIASREDLLAVADRPEPQLGALRAAVGQRPALVLTDGARGTWLDLAGSDRGAARWRLPVPRPVEGVPSVGAGDMLAALLLLPAWPRSPSRDFLSRRAADAMRGVADLLARRR